MNEKELRRQLRRVRHRETEILAKSRFGKAFSLESILNKYLPDSLEQTLDSAFREAFRLIFAKGTSVISKTFNEKKLRESDSSGLESQKRWATDMLITSVEGTGLGLIGVGLPDIPVFTGMLLRTVYQTAASYQFEYTTKTEQVFILQLIEAALARGKKAEQLSSELDELMHRIDVEGYEYYGNINKQIERASKALSDETLYLKFVQTVPVVGIAGGLSNPIYMNKIKSYAEVKYQKRRLLIQMRELRAAAAEEPSDGAVTPAAPGALEAPVEAVAENVSETPNKPVEEEVSEASSDPATEGVSESPTDPATEGVSESPVEAVAENVSKAPAGPAERQLNISVYDPEEE